MDNLNVVKIGGKIVDNARLRQAFLCDFAALKGPKLLVHGGGKTASKVCEQRGIPVKLINGRRLTDQATLIVLEEVYEQLNQEIVTALQHEDCSAKGISGKTNHIVFTQKRQHANIDYGFVGDLDVEHLDSAPLLTLLNAGNVPVFNALTQTVNGQVLNTNADTIASTIAQAMSMYFNVHLSFCFEKNGVLTSITNDDSWLETLPQSSYLDMVKTGQISAGMLPKIDNGFSALKGGVKKVCIKNAANLLTPTGTTLSYD